MAPYASKRKGTKSLNNEPNEGGTSSLHLQNTMREMMKKMILQQKSQEEPPISSTISQPEKVQQSSEPTVMQKLSRFKKFAPPTFNDAKTPTEAEDWLYKLKKILELLQAEDSDRMMYVEFLLEGEASNWWKIEKRRLDKIKVTWEDFEMTFLRHYFPQSVCEQKEQEFMFLK